MQKFSTRLIRIRQLDMDLKLDQYCYKESVFTLTFDPLTYVQLQDLIVCNFVCDSWKEEMLSPYQTWDVLDKCY